MHTEILRCAQDDISKHLWVSISDFLQPELMGFEIEGAVYPWSGERQEIVM